MANKPTNQENGNAAKKTRKKGKRARKMIYTVLVSLAVLLTPVLNGEMLPVSLEFKIDMPINSPQQHINISGDSNAVLLRE